MSSSEDLSTFKSIEQPKELPFRDLDVTPDKAFRIYNQRLFLTYKTHIPRDRIKSFFSQKSPSELEIAHETGDEHHSYPHTHVYIDFGKRFQSFNPRIFDIDGIHPHIKKVINHKHVENIYRYLCKEDTNNVHLLSKITQRKSLAEKVWECDTKIDALKKHVSKPSDVIGISVLHDNKPYQPKEMDITFHEWQQYLERELLIPPDDRRVIWYVDTIGNVGKSFYCRYRAMARSDVVLTNFDPRHVATLLKNAINQGKWSGNVVFGDIPRSSSTDSTEIYQSIEMIKNGMITSTKYQSETVFFNPPHVVIFANSPPDFSQLSYDRWDVRDISGTVPSPLNNPPIPSPPPNSSYTSVPPPRPSPPKPPSKPSPRPVLSNLPRPTFRPPYP